MANQCPAREVLEDSVLIVMEDSDVDIPVIARLPTKPSIRSPVPADNLIRPAEGRSQCGGPPRRRLPGLLQRFTWAA